MLLTKLFLFACLNSHGLLADGASISLESRSLRATHSNLGPADGVGSDSENAGFAPPAATEALARVAAAEDVRTSRILCRVAGGDGQNSVTVRLQPSSNSRSLVFNDDQEGVETTVKCRGEPDPKCLADVKTNVNTVEECPECPCTENTGHLSGEYATAMAREVNSRCGRGQGGDSDARPRVLLLGLGAGEIAEHMVTSCGGSDLEAVELDGRLPVLATRYFGLPTSVKTTVGDAFPVVSAMERSVAEDQLLADQRRFDTILVDCFSTGGVTPEHCRSVDFVRNLHALLRDGGMVMHHMWHEDQRHPQVPTDFSNTIATYQEIFNCKGCEVHVEKLPSGPDSLIVASFPGARN